MERINYQKLVEAGYTPTQIEQILAVNPNAEVYNRPETPITSQEAKTMILNRAPVTQEFGNYNPGLYRGINQSMRNTGTDFGVPTGTDINLPSGEWVVEEVGTGYNRGYGNSVAVRNAQTGERLRFSHLSKMLRVQPGQNIQGGQLLAKSGATGNVTGPHLDLEYYDNQGQLGDVLQSKYRETLGY